MRESRWVARAYEACRSLRLAMLSEREFTSGRRASLVDSEFCSLLKVRWDFALSHSNVNNTLEQTHAHCGDPPLPRQGPLAGASEFADLAAGQTIVNDRRYAIENGPSGFDRPALVPQPKIKFLMLMRNERLARLRTTLRRRQHDAHHRRWRPASGARRSLHQGRAPCHRGLFPDLHAQGAARSPEGAGGRRVIPSRTWPPKWCRSST